MLALPLAVQAESSVRVAVAADFYKPLQSLAIAFKRQTGIRLLISPGSSGGLYAQITNGAPYDVFLSANVRYPRRLAAAGLADSASRFTYAQGVLVLWGAQKTPAAGPDSLQNGAFAHLALANPRFAPYGQAAQEVLTRLGLLKQLHSKLVFGEDVGQALQFAISGGARYAFVSSAQLRAAGLWHSGTRWIVPESLYAPINQQAVLLAHARHPKAAQKFLQFLRGPARPLIISMGYHLSSAHVNH